MLDVSQGGQGIETFGESEIASRLMWCYICYWTRAIVETIVGICSLCYTTF